MTTKRGSIDLTKDSLAKCNWQGSEMCCFCHKNWTIKHLFFECRFAHAIWSCIHVALNLPQPRSIPHMFGSWLNGFRRDLKPLLLLGPTVTCWSLWLCRNDLVFEKNMFILPCRWYIRLFIGSAHGLSFRSSLCMLWLRRHRNT